jgi:hypothetical protein
MAIVTGIAMLVILGFAGLALDLGAWQMAKSRMQGSADRAAAAAAKTLMSGGSLDTATTRAKAIAASSGFIHGAGSVTVAVYSPPTTGANSANSTAAEVIISQPQPQWFSQFFVATAPTVQSRAVAMPSGGGSGCILALNPTAADTIYFAGNPTVAAPDCVIVSDSSSSSAIHLQGSARVIAQTLVTPGSIRFTGGAYTLNLATPAQTSAQAVPDPYASTLTHAALTANMPSGPNCTKSSGTWSGNCIVPGSLVGSGERLSANTQISGGLAIKNGTVTVAPGTYWITDGDLELQSGSGAILAVHVVHPRRLGRHDHPDNRTVERRQGRHLDPRVERSPDPECPKFGHVRGQGSDPGLAQPAIRYDHAHDEQRTGKRHRDARRPHLLSEIGSDLPGRSGRHEFAMSGPCGGHDRHAGQPRAGHLRLRRRRAHDPAGGEYRCAGRRVSLASALPQIRDGDHPGIHSFRNRSRWPSSQ